VSISVLLGNGTEPSDRYRLRDRVAALVRRPRRLHGDGKLDVVSMAATFRCWLVTARHAASWTGLDRAGVVRAADMNGDGKSTSCVRPDEHDLARAGLGTGSFGTPTYFPVAAVQSRSWSATSTVIGKLDAATASFDSNTVSVVLGTGGGSLGPHHETPRYSKHPCRRRSHRRRTHRPRDGRRGDPISARSRFCPARDGTFARRTRFRPAPAHTPWPSETSIATERPTS